MFQEFSFLSFCFIFAIYNNFFDPLTVMEKMSSSSYKHRRNMKERERRMHMKGLTAILASLVPSQSNKFTVPGLLDESTRYLKNLQERVQNLKQVRNELAAELRVSCMDNDVKAASGTTSPPLPVIDISSCCDESTLGVNIFAKFKKLLLRDLIHVLHEEGAEVIDLTYHDSGNGFIYMFKLKALYARVGIDSSRIRVRLTELVYAAQNVIENKLS